MLARKITAVVVALLVALPAANSLGVITGEFTSEPVCKVNGNLTHDFTSSGDYLLTSAGCSVEVGADDPATTFFQSMIMTADAGQFIAANTNDSEFVQPSGIDLTTCVLGYAVPGDYYSYYDVFTDLRYWDSATMAFVELDVEYGWYNTN